MGKWPDKDPNAVLSYDVKWHLWLAPGETLATSVFDVIEGDVVIDSMSNTATVATAQLSGGTAGTKCTIQNHITTSDGNIDDRTIEIRIKEK